MLSKNVNVNSRNEQYNTPLHKSFQNQDYDMIVLLLGQGADQTAINELGQTPLYFGGKKLLEKLGMRN